MFLFSFSAPLDLTRFPSMLFPYLGNASTRGFSHHWTHKGNLFLERLQLGHCTYTYISALTGLPCPCCPAPPPRLGLPDSLFPTVPPVSTPGTSPPALLPINNPTGNSSTSDEDKSKENEAMFNDSVAELRRKALEHTRQQLNSIEEMAKNLEKIPNKDE